MGSVFKQDKPKTQAQPAPPPVTYINEASGYEQVPVKNDDGSITYITRELKLSPEEQKKKDELDKIASDALAEIELLSSSDYVASQSTQKLLDDWQTTQETVLEESFSDRKELEEDRLAKRGLSDSTAGETVRRQAKQDKYDANKEVGRERSAIASSIRQTELNNQQNLYSLAQNKLNYDQTMVANNSKGDLSAINAMNRANAASINDYYRANTNSTNSFFDPLMQRAEKSTSTIIDSGVDGFINTITGGFSG